MTEGVFDFTADEGKSENDVGGNCDIVRLVYSVEWMGYSPTEAGMVTHSRKS